GFAFLRLMKGKKGTVADLAEQVGFAARAAKKGKTRKAAAPVGAAKAAAPKQVAKAARTVDASRWTELLTKVRIVNAASPKRPHIVGSSKSSPKKMRPVTE
ncbi:unnamed protein product, partial [Prorocentrum cordatum]